MRCRTPETAAIGLDDYDPTPTLFVRGQPVHVANAVLFLAYLGALCRAGDAHVLELQRYILVVMLIGLVEAGTWFFSYLGPMNGSGHPSCCPVENGLKAAIVANVAKETMSRLLVLGVYAVV